MLKQKSSSKGDPLTHFGIMTLNHNIPYKKPILKSMPMFVNARGVIQELEDFHGGLHTQKNNQQDDITLAQNQKPKKDVSNFIYINNALKRIRSAKPRKYKALLLCQESSFNQDSGYNTLQVNQTSSRGKSPTNERAVVLSHTAMVASKGLPSQRMLTRNYSSHGRPTIFRNTEVAQSLRNSNLL